MSSFSDGEIRVKIEENVRGADVFVVQSTCHPVNDSLMELLIIIDALKRSRPTASRPSFPTSVTRARIGRTSRGCPSRRSSWQISSLLPVRIACSRWIFMPGRFRGSSTCRWTISTPCRSCWITSRRKRSSDLVVVSPDAGGVERARAFAKRLQANLAIIDKRREGPNQTQIMNIIGDVQGKSVLLLDDMIDTAGTIVQGAQACLDQGAREVIDACTHAVLTGPALERIQASCLPKSW